MFNNKTFFITGGTGSFGENFVINLLSNFKPKKIIIYSRDEFKQTKMQAKLFNLFPGILKKNIIRFFIGDIRDNRRLKLAITSNIDLVVHAAALKHVPICEYNPFEAVKTNIIGAQNLIEACLEKNIEKVIALSTDKASSPVNLYGATKLTSDKLFIAANNFKGKAKTKFSVVRYGNVMGSRGSVIPIIIKNLKTKKFNLTDSRMTRFNITLDQSVDFVFSCFKLMKGGEIFVPKLPSYKITDLVKSFSENFKITKIGIRPGEKLHEEMISSSESLNTIEFNNFFIIIPSSLEFNTYNIKNYSNYKGLKGKILNEEFSYNSFQNNHYLNIQDIKKLIKINQNSFYTD